MNGVDDMKHIHMRLNELLSEKEISKNQICKDLGIWLVAISIAIAEMNFRELMRIWL